MLSAKEARNKSLKLRQEVLNTQELRLRQKIENSIDVAISIGKVTANVDITHIEAEVRNIIQKELTDAGYTVEFKYNSATFNNISQYGGGTITNHYPYELIITW